MSESLWQWQIVAVALGLALATVAIYWPATRCGFVNFDDNLYVTENPHVRRGLSLEAIGWAFVSTEVSNWHPLTWLSHLLDSTIWGVNPQSAFGHHLTSVVLHGMNAALLFGVWWMMTRSLWSSALLAALFAWHPLRVESVAWIAERKDVLSGLFWIVTIGLYVHYVRGSHSWWRYCAVLVGFAAGVMAKPMVITLPFVLLLLDYWPLGRFSWTTRVPDLRALVPLVREKLPLGGLVLISGCLTYYSQWVSGAVVTDRLSLAARLTNALSAYWIYLGQLIWPQQLAVFYPFRTAQISWPVVFAASMALSLAILAAVVLRRRVPVFMIGWLWYLGTLIPVIGLVQVGGQAHADRYTYLPSIGVAWIISWTLATLVQRSPQTRLPILICLAVALALLVTATLRQQRFWRDSEALFTRATQVSPDSALAWSNLGAALTMTGRADEAVQAYRRAESINPAQDVQAGLATALAAQRRFAESIESFRNLIQTYPDNSKLANNLAWILATVKDSKLRDPVEAIRLGELANKLSPENPAILDTLAAAYAAGGRFDQAVLEADRAIALAVDQRNPQLASSIQSRREIYMRGQPYLE
ncbi:MAG: tetratricopeptide repeat protein [Pirellulaceae bacterium]|nr:tetratricopeptide repeat protein [Pirellulaceae bacterium]